MHRQRGGAVLCKISSNELTIFQGPSPPSITTQVQRRQLSVSQTGLRHVVLTMGSQGAALCNLSPCGGQVLAHHFPAVPASIVNTSGAGDCLVAGALARLVQGASAQEAVAFGVVMLFARDLLASVRCGLRPWLWPLQ